jgi:hypothetical protein
MPMKNVLNFVLCYKAVPHFLYDELGRKIIVLYSGMYSKLCPCVDLLLVYGAVAICAFMWVLHLCMIQCQIVSLWKPFSCV